MPADSFLRLLQFSDGLFPAGGYAHSFGLETLVQSGRVRNESDVTAFLAGYLESSAAPTDAVVVLCARKYALAHDLDACICLDHLLDALKPAAEVREASRQMGRQTLRVLRELSKSDLLDSVGLGERRLSPDANAGFGALAPEATGENSSASSAEGIPDQFAAALESGATPCHHPVVFGIAAAVSGWPPRETASAFLYSTSAVIAGASLRLLPLGQLSGQRILAQAGTLIASLSESILDRTEDDLHSFTPELEIAAMLHESLDARLFRS